MNNTFLDIKESIESFDKIIIIPHARPDGDCIGSAFGLKDILVQSYPNKKIYAVGEETDYLKFIGRMDTLEDDDFQDALVIAVDTGNQSRLADQRYGLGKKLIKIDHHINVNPYGDIEYVDTTAPAAAQIIVEFYQTFEDTLTMSPKGALALFTGMLTDTGRFKYPGVGARTFKAVALLFEKGLEPSPIYDHLDTKTEELVRFKGYVLLNYQKTPNGVAFIKITDELRQTYGVTMEEASSLVNELSVFDDCPIWVLLAEYEENIVRARIRSKGPTISEIANQFEGGGHALASGANLGTWENAEKLLAALDGHAKAYKEELL